MNLDEMLLNGVLVREPPASREIERLLRSARRRIDDARNEGSHPETRLAQAYEAIRLCATVALRAEGYRAANEKGKHFVTIETLEDTLGIPLDHVDYFQELRELRHKGLYEGETSVPASQVEEATEAATQLLEQLGAWLEARGE